MYWNPFLYRIFPLICWPISYKYTYVCLFYVLLRCSKRLLFNNLTFPRSVVLFLPDITFKTPQFLLLLSVRFYHCCKAFINKKCIILFINIIHNALIHNPVHVRVYALYSGPTIDFTLFDLRVGLLTWYWINVHDIFYWFSISDHNNSC